MKTSILFMCPHNAAKSVLAMSFAENLIQENGFTDIKISSAGTDPDAVNSPAIVQYLKEKGFPLPASDPKMVSTDDLNKADLVVSLGCDLSAYTLAKEKVVDWGDVPQPSQDLHGSANEIFLRVEKLVNDIAST